MPELTNVFLFPVEYRVLEFEFNARRYRHSRVNLCIPRTERDVCVYLETIITMLNAQDHDVLCA